MPLRGAAQARSLKKSERKAGGSLPETIIKYQPTAGVPPLQHRRFSKIIAFTAGVSNTAEYFYIGALLKQFAAKTPQKIYFAYSMPP